MVVAAFNSRALSFSYFCRSVLSIVLCPHCSFVEVKMGILLLSRSFVRWQVES